MKINLVILKSLKENKLYTAKNNKITWKIFYKLNII